MKGQKFYVLALTRKLSGEVYAYIVCEDEGTGPLGIRYEHARYDVTDKQPAYIAKHLAAMHAKDLNEGVE